MPRARLISPDFWQLTKEEQENLKTYKQRWRDFKIKVE